MRRQTWWDRRWQLVEELSIWPDHKPGLVEFVVRRRRSCWNLLQTREKDSGPYKTRHQAMAAQAEWVRKGFIAEIRYRKVRPSLPSPGDCWAAAERILAAARFEAFFPEE